MRVLYFIFERFGVLLLFFLIEVFCFFLIVRFNDTQGMIFFSSINQATGSFHNISNKAVDFVKLDEIADSLVSENAALRQELSLLKNNKVTLRDTITQDSLRQEYTYLGAEVIKNSINLRNNLITINKGSKDGVKAHMGVITSKGVIGIVRKVGKDYALVMSILNSQSIVNAKIKKTGYFGPLVWKDRDSKKMYLEDIPKHAVLSEGDTIQTTGYSSIFPTGIDIGAISFKQLVDGSNSHEIHIELFENLANIQYVYVVNNLKKDEIEKLEKELIDEQK